MIFVSLNKEQYISDIHSIIGAFYKGQKIFIDFPEKSKKIEAKADITTNISIDFYESEVALRIGQVERKLNVGTFLKEYSEKDEFKAFLYASLSDILNINLPWGNLTGIRPTKLAYGMLEKGCSDEEVEHFLTKKHFVSKEKIKLSIDIAKRERKLLSNIHYKEGYSLYVGIPFCPTTCLYCSFTSYPISCYQQYTEQYIDCLIQEMILVKELMKDKILDTVYIGGGTPTTLEATQLERLIVALKEHFDFSTVQEFTVEAGRADSITEAKLKVLYEQGVDRISINPQTMNDDTLKVIGRQHSVAQVIDTFHLARKIGFTNINMDLILGLPKEDIEQVMHTIRGIKELAPDSITVHSLAIKRASKLGKWIEENDIELIQNTEETMALTEQLAKELSLQPYYLYRQKNMAGNFENIGYAQEGKFGIYNILMMEEKQTILAIGAGSISKVVAQNGEISRCDNVKEVILYIQNINEMLQRKRNLLKGENDGRI